ncbi:thioredoxin [soil metagenome]
MALDLFGSKPAAPKNGGGDAAADIVDATDASFMADVIEASKTRPVVIDFWAPWCGPCRQLGPSLEKHVASQQGKVRLAKINIDENPQVAAQFRVQSIPAVFVVDQGKAFQGFMGALPDSQVKAFIDELAAGIPGGEADDGGLEEILAFAAEALAAGDTPGAAQAYAQALQLEPQNVKAITGLARCYLALGETDRAQEVANLAPETSNDPDLVSVRAQLKLAAAAPPADSAEDAALRARLTADPDDHQARFDLAKSLSARGDLDGAAEELFTIMAKDRAFADDGARKELLTVFEAAGPTSELARSGRRRMSSLLFS